MKNRGEYPYHPGAYGISFPSSPGETMVTGGSGDVLTITITPDQIDVCSCSSKRFLMKAALDSQGSLGFDLYTRSEGRVHPDMFARQFFRFALQRFNQMGREVDSIDALWNPGSLNYDQFYAVWTNEADSNRAARKTWTGQRARENGFPVVEYVGVSQSVVVALFTRPQRPIS